VDSRSAAPLALDLVPGGPTFRLMLRAGLADPAAPRLVRASILFVLTTWIPLALLALLSGTALEGGVAQPFARDFAVHARLLLAVPLFILSDVLIGPKLRAVAATFVRAGLVRERDRGAYEEAVRACMRRRDSGIAETILVALALLGSFAAMATRLGSPIEGWAVHVDAGVAHLTLAGWLYALVGLPVFQFLLLRSLWRALIWGRFLSAMARLDLAIVPTHPDHAGGLGFLGVGQTSWVVLVFGLSIVLAASFADAVIYGDSHVLDFKLPVAVYGVIAAVGLLGPLQRFSRQLGRARFAGLLEYGALVHDHHLAFDRKWIAGDAERNESLLGNPDASSLADTSAGYELVASMRTLPVALRDVVPLVFAVVLPMIPLLAIEIPIAEILGKLLKIIA
jgi:hypothetical protein